MQFEEFLKRIAILLNAESIPYMIVGGQAVLIHGEPRLTRDIDITLGLPPFDPAPLLHLVEKLSLQCLVTNPQEFLRETFVLPVLDPKTGIRLDLICSLSEYERGAIDRAVEILFDDVTVRFISREDLLIHKIIAGRPRDLEDARLIALKHSDLDRAFIRKWLKAHDNELATDFEARFDELLETVKK